MFRTAVVIVVSSAICFAATFENLSKLAAYPGRGRQEQDQQAEELAVKISPLKNVIVSGETLQLRVEIWNMGTQDVFICKDFRGPTVAFCNLRLSFEPATGGPRRGWAADVGFPNETKESFVSALVRNWISIPPKHFYGTIVEIAPSSYGIDKVGRYRITGRYVSGGLLTPADYNRLLPYRAEVAQLPGKSWQGQVATNSVVVRVIAKKN